MSDSPSSGPTPYLLSLLICDSVYVDERTKKKVICGIFDNINANTFPIEHKPIAIFARVTDAEGEYDFRFDYVQVNNDKLLGRAHISPIIINDRLKSHDIVMEPPPILLPEPGEYEFRLFANNRYIGRVKFAAIEVMTEHG